VLKKKTKLLLADDHRLFRESVKVFLETSDDSFHVELAGSLHEAESILECGDLPDLLLIDLGMPGMNGIASVRRLCDRWPNLPVALVSANDDPVAIRGCLEAGAVGFIPKKNGGDDFIKAIRDVLSKHITAPTGALSTAMPRFSEKKMAILLLLTKGMSNKEIARHVHLTEATIKQYMRDIFLQLGVTNRVQAADRARKILGLEY